MILARTVSPGTPLRSLTQYVPPTNNSVTEEVSPTHEASASFVFRTKRGGPLLETTVLNQGLYPALAAIGLSKVGMHAFRRGCNRRRELAGINPAVIRQQMGHTAATMTRLYTGELPLEDVAAAFSMKFGNQIVVLENMENEVAA